MVWSISYEVTDGICGYDLDTGQVFQLAEDTYSQSDPAIYGDIVVWEDDRNGNSDIYGCILSTHPKPSPVYSESLKSTFEKLTRLEDYWLFLIAVGIMLGIVYSYISYQKRSNTEVPP